MAHIVDERGYNQIFRPTLATTIRLQRRARAIIQALPPSVGGKQQRRILELGCGMGDLSFEVSGQTSSRVTGVDLSLRFIDHARATYQRPNLDFIVADLTREIPGKDEGDCDAIIGNGILHHLYHHLDDVLPALHRWLRPGGRLIFWEPNLCNPYVWLIFTRPTLRHKARLEPDEMAFTPRFIAQKLVRAGFNPHQIETKDFLLPNTPACLVKPLAATSDLLDRIPLVNRLAQSVFLVAEKPAT